MSDNYLFWQDAYQKNVNSAIKSILENQGLILEKTLFYPTSGGQPYDKGKIEINNHSLDVIDVKKFEKDQIIIFPEVIPSDIKEGMLVKQIIDWDLRYKHMKMHTALHLLSVVVPLPVTGGKIGDNKSRLDFNMPEIIGDKQLIEDKLNNLIQEDLKIEQLWISEKELGKKPELIKTMSVSPPKGKGDIRLIRINSEEEQVDLQPCGGTHVRKTSEIGRVRIGKIEKKGKNNRRINIHFED